MENKIAYLFLCKKLSHKRQENLLLVLRSYRIEIMSFLQLV